MSDTPKAPVAVIFYVAPPQGLGVFRDEDRRYSLVVTPRSHKGKGERKRNRRDRWR